MDADSLDIVAICAAWNNPGTTVRSSWILSQIENEEREDVRKVAVTILKYRLEEARKTVDDSRFSRRKGMCLTKAEVQLIELFAMIERRPDMVLFFGHVQPAVLQALPAQERLKNNIVIVETEIVRCTPLMPQVEIEYGNYLQFQDELFAPLLEAYKALKTSLELLLEDRRADLADYKNMKDRLGEILNRNCRADAVEIEVSSPPLEATFG